VLLSVTLATDYGNSPGVPLAKVTGGWSGSYTR